MSPQDQVLDCVPLPVMKDPSENRRETTRVHCNVAVQLRASDGREIAATCVDVNSSGVGIESQHVLAVGQRLTLLSANQQGERTSVPMLVIYRMQNHYGLSALGAFQEVLNLIPTQA
jgi:hypothetical protein